MFSHHIPANFPLAIGETQTLVIKAMHPTRAGVVKSP